MIKLPPGCTITNAITIEVQYLTDEMVDWYEQFGGAVTGGNAYYIKGREITKKYVSFGRGKRCHYHASDSGGVRLHFLGEDAQSAMLFILTFSDKILQHNFPELAT
jgi:hypothetical protein